MILSDIEIGRAIRNRRRELGLTQEDLAEQIEVTSRQIFRYEHGVNKLHVKQLQAIAHALDTPISHFFREKITAEEELPETSLDEAEQRLIEQFRRIENGAGKELVINLLKEAIVEG